MRKIIIATHGDLSKGLKDSLMMIAGDTAQKIETYSLYPGENPIDYSKKLEKEIEQNSAIQYFIFGDLYGASVINSMLRISSYNNAFVFSGVNLILVLQVLLHPESEEIKQDNLELYITNAQNDIKLLQIEDIEDDDF